MNGYVTHLYNIWATVLWSAPHTYIDRYCDVLYTIGYHYVWLCENRILFIFWNNIITIIIVSIVMINN